VQGLGHLIGQRSAYAAPMQVDVGDATPHDLPVIVDLLNATLASTT
jgi:hypothetical protein